MWVTFDESSQGNEEKVLRDTTSLFLFYVFFFSLSYPCTDTHAIRAEEAQDRLKYSLQSKSKNKTNT